jgi:uncharacterized protein involved in exopolysaccharide biosynthesis
MRYWWLVAVFAVVGGALSLSFAMLKTKKYQSWATLFYQERIQSQLLSPTREEVAQRNIGDKYRELLLARAQLERSSPTKPIRSRRAGVDQGRQDASAVSSSPAAVARSHRVHRR